jgi:hypothetical protein
MQSHFVVLSSDLVFVRADILLLIVTQTRAYAHRNLDTTL